MVMMLRSWPSPTQKWRRYIMCDLNYERRQMVECLRSFFYLKIMSKYERIRYYVYKKYARLYKMVK